MLQDSRHVRLRDLAQAILVLGVIEDVLAGLQARQALVRVHPRPVDAVDRLRHEAREESVLFRDLLQRVLEGRGVVRGAERIRILEVDLVLSGCNLVVRRLDLDAERLERIHHVLADLDPLVVGEVEVARTVMRCARRLAVGADLEEEELQLRAHVDLVAELRGALHLATQHAARIAGKRLAVRQHHVADDARGARAALRRQPRQHAPRVHVGAQQLIGFGDPREALDRRSVEPGAVLDRTGHLVDGDLHALHGAVDVHELQLHRLDARLLRLRHRGQRVAHLRIAPPGCRLPSALRHAAPHTWLDSGSRRPKLVPAAQIPRRAAPGSAVGGESSGSNPRSIGRLRAETL